MKSRLGGPLPVMPGRWLAIALLIGCLCIVVGCQSQAGPASPWRGTYKVGLVLPFYGYDASTAYNILLASKLALAEWNQRGGVDGRRLELVALDDEGDGLVAANQARELAIDPAMLGVVGHLDSDTALSAAHEYRKAPLALLTLGGSANAVTDAARPGVFRLCASDADRATAIVRTLRSLGVRRVALVTASTPGYEAQAKALAQAVVAGGMDVAATASVAPHAREFGALIEATTRGEADLLVFSGGYKQAALLADALASALPRARFLVSGDADTPDFARLVGNATVAPLYAASLVDTESAAAREFAERYRQTAGSAPHAFARLAYDATNALLIAATRILERGEQPTRERVIAALCQVRVDNGAAGSLMFDAQGANRGTRTAVRVIKDRTYPGETIAEKGALVYGR